MVKKYKIISYENGEKLIEIIEAFSKYDAKQRFYKKYPKADFIKIEEMK